MNIYDIHCHVLPGMDDGCHTPKESIDLIKESKRQKISGIIATPHYYPRESVSQFLERRKQSYERLLMEIKSDKADLLPMCLGAEVAYHTGLVYEEKLFKLCLGKSRYMLLEMPFQKWSPAVLRDIRSIRNVIGIIPVIAHLERYFKYQDADIIDELRECDVLVQMNAEYILGGFWDWRKAKKLLKNELVDVLGSDSHNMTARCPNLGLAAEKLNRSGMEDILYDLSSVSCHIFEEALGGTK